MCFRLTEDQWAHCQALVKKLGGYETTTFVRSEIEEAISRTFTGPKLSNEFAKVLVEVADAAKAFQAAVEQLAAIEWQRAGLADMILAESIERSASEHTKFAQHVERYEASIREQLEFRGDECDVPRRGRPVDLAIVSLCMVLLRIGKHERWTVKDRLGHTSPAFIDLAEEVAAIARLGGLTHVRDRRAVGRAMTQARKRHEAEERKAAQLYAALDAVGRS